jgi:DNA invertase Pin-like site-specific DNA recombinase
VFIDKASGKPARRPELDRALLSANRNSDQLVITKLDRLGRSLEHLIELSKDLQARGVDLVVLDQGIDTSTARSGECSSKSSARSPSSNTP